MVGFALLFAVLLSCCEDRARSPEAAVAEGPRDRTSSLVNAVLCYTLLEVLQRLGLPLLAFGRFWALLACVLFWLWHSIEPSRPPKKWNPRAEAANNEPVEVFLETLARELDERKPPLDPAALRAASWQDISTKGAEVFIKFVKEPKMTTQVCLNIESHDQEPDFPWIVVENDKLAGGAVPIFLALELWPAWFPFCQFAGLWGLDRQQGIYLLRYKIAFLTVDIVMPGESVKAQIRIRPRGTCNG
ncbi:unnamed protein product [Symbiodinium sp. CCMP2592]|nr:unnamed protein product [Symbiodinium sp. CCMP2592]